MSFFFNVGGECRTLPNIGGKCRGGGNCRWGGDVGGGGNIVDSLMYVFDLYLQDATHVHATIYINVCLRNERDLP